MSNTIWKAREEIVTQVHKLINDNHPHLSYLIEDICVMFREAARKSGGQLIHGRVFKCSDFVNAIANTQYELVMELAADSWTTLLDETGQEALLDSLLCSISVEENPKSGEMKIKILKPDLQAFRDNVDRYGMWMPKTDDVVITEDEEEALEG